MARGATTDGPDRDGPLPTKRTCAAMEVHHRLLRTDPRYAENRTRIEEAAFRAEKFLMAQRTGCTMIPVVVHVVHRNDAENISDAQINSQIRVLNEDFRKKNADVTSVPAPFVPLAADARIMFELAKTDPSNNPTTGITRTRTTASGFNQDDRVKAAATGGADPWPSDRYLNIWVCHLTGGLLGYAQFPGGPAETDGVVIRQSAFGTTGTAAAPFNLGRTTTHEVGHWLNLRHIWGDDGDGCGGSDFVADTPNQGGPNTGTPTFPTTSCSNGPHGDMFMNYMDYTDDAGMFMFSAGQVVRMQACLDGPRSTMGRGISCEPVKPNKENPKDSVKERPKDRPKEVIKDWPKEFAKEHPKDFSKDRPKDWSKERPKDLIKDRPKEGVFDPPKNIFDNPKGIFEQPGGGFPHLPAQPWLGGTGGGAIPFTLGGRSDQHGSVDDDAARMQVLHGAYTQILEALQALAAAGLLDEGGQALAQQLIANYQLLASGQA